MKVSVSIVVPVYNVAKYLPECLDSLINQTLKEIEIICVNDGSTDNSLQILNEYADRDHRIKIISQSNKGLSGARNSGIRHVQGSYIAFVDSDDWIDLNFCEKLYDIAREYDADLVRACTLRHLKNGIIEEIPFNEILRHRSKKNELLSISEHNVTVWDAIYKTSIIKDKKIFFDEGLIHEDIPWTAKITFYAEKKYPCSNTFYHYRCTRDGTLASDVDSIVIANKKAFDFINIAHYNSKKDYIDSVSRIFWRYNYHFICNFANLKFSKSARIKFLKFWVQSWIALKEKEAVYNIYPPTILTSKDWFLLSENELFKKLQEIYCRPVIISLTSYPARIPTIHYTIESLLNQTIPADKVVLFLAPEQFPNKEKDLPEKLLNLQKQGLEINWYHDIKSYKKLIPALKKYPESLIITVDDDVIYQKTIVERLLKAYVLNPNMIHTLRAHDVCLTKGKLAPYNSWPKELKSAHPSYNNFFTSGGGVLYPPYCLHSDVLDEEKFLSLSPHADDVWFWAMALHQGTKINLITNQGDPYVPIDGTQNENSLWIINVQNGENDKQLSAVLNAYPDILDKLDRTHKLPKEYRLSIPLLHIKTNNQKVLFKILGIPMWKIRYQANKKKYYFLGIRIFTKKIKNN